MRIKVTARKRGERLTLDFSGTDAQAKGPVNTPGPTAQAVSLLAVIAASDPTIPMNSGVLDAVDFVMPPGTLVNPQYPASVNHYFPTSHVVYTCVLAALGKLNPARAVAPAGFGTGAIAIGYSKGRAGKPTVQYELMVTSLGGTSTHDGTSIVLPMNHFTPGTPVEIVETEYPVMVRRFDIWRDSAGAGRQRGGIGHVREYQLLVDCILTARTSSHRQGAWGLYGGERPPLSRTVINPDTPQAEEMDCMETRAGAGRHRAPPRADRRRRLRRAERAAGRAGAGGHRQRLRLAGGGGDAIQARAVLAACRPRASGDPWCGERVARCIAAAAADPWSQQNVLLDVLPLRRGMHVAAERDVRLVPAFAGTTAECDARVRPSRLRGTGQCHPPHSRTRPGSRRCARRIPARR